MLPSLWHFYIKKSTRRNVRLSIWNALRCHALIGVCYFATGVGEVIVQEERRSHTKLKNS